jgi:hypothetical protein
VTRRQLSRLRLALADFCVEDILSTTDDEILAELREEGVDPQELLESARKAFERVFADAKART